MPKRDAAADDLQELPVFMGSGFISLRDAPE
jgi:hypothetical protein